MSGSMRNKCYGDDQYREHCLLVQKHEHFKQQQALAIQLRELQGEDLRSYVRAHLERIGHDSQAFLTICQKYLGKNRFSAPTTATSPCTSFEAASPEQPTGSNMSKRQQRDELVQTALRRAQEVHDRRQSCEITLDGLD